MVVGFSRVWTKPLTRGVYSVSSFWQFDSSVVLFPSRGSGTMSNISFVSSGLSGAQQVVNHLDHILVIPRWRQPHWYNEAILYGAPRSIFICTDLARGNVVSETASRVVQEPHHHIRGLYSHIAIRGHRCLACLTRHPALAGNMVTDFLLTSCIKLQDEAHWAFLLVLSPSCLVLSV